MKNNSGAGNDEGEDGLLSCQLEAAALASSSTRAEAASALIAASCRILVADFGVFKAVEMLQYSLDQSVAHWRATLN